MSGELGKEIMSGFIYVRATEAVVRAARAFRAASDPDPDNYPYAGFSVVAYEDLCDTLDALEKAE